MLRKETLALLHEELLTAEEGTTATNHSCIFVAKPNGIDVDRLENIVHIVRERGSSLTKEEVIGLFA